MSIRLRALCMPLLIAAIAFSGSTSAAEQDEKAPVLVQMRGKFVSITPTGKRRQSYIFEFKVSEQLNGPGQAPTPKDQVLKFEMYESDAQREFVAKLKNTEDLPKGPRYDVVFWLQPGRTYPVGVPVPVPEKP